jgi:hypothetical protein
MMRRIHPPLNFPLLTSVPLSTFHIVVCNVFNLSPSEPLEGGPSHCLALSLLQIVSPHKVLKSNSFNAELG